MTVGFAARLVRVINSGLLDPEPIGFITLSEENKPFGVMLTLITEDKLTHFNFLVGRTYFPLIRVTRIY